MQTIQTETVDVDDVRALIAELDAHLNALYRPEDCHGLSLDQLRHPTVTLLVARVDGEAVGCGAIKRFAGEHDGYAEIKRMYVRPDRRGQGIAKAILTELERHALDDGFIVLRLETGIHQTEAMGLYERTGFTRSARFGDYEDTEVSVFYEKHLEPSVTGLQ